MTPQIEKLSAGEAGFIESDRGSVSSKKSSKSGITEKELILKNNENIKESISDLESWASVFDNNGEIINPDFIKE